MNLSNSRAFVDAIHPRVAIMDNGAHKAGSPEAWQTVHESPGLEDLYMLHTAEGSDAAHNSAEALIANLKGGGDGAYFKVVASADGSFSVTNSRTGQDQRISGADRTHRASNIKENNNMSLSRRDVFCRSWVRPAQLPPCRAPRTPAVPSALPSSTTKSRRTSITPATSPRTTSACSGSSCAACGTRTSPNSTRLRSTKALGILAKYKLRVTDIASPLYKADWPGAPLSKQSERRDQFHADFDFKQQDALLEHCIELAKTFHTDRIRCFDFWRLDDVKPYRAAINDKLREAARRCAKDDLILLLENEMSCNTATGEEVRRHARGHPRAELHAQLGSRQRRHFPRQRCPIPTATICCPSIASATAMQKTWCRKPDGKWEWAPVGTGVVDWVGQLRALDRDGFRYAVSLETHWRGAGTPEASSRISMQGLKEALAKAGTGC